MKYFKYLKNPLLFPVVFIILHIITYGVFFAITDYNSLEPWHSVERGSSRNLFVFYKTYWPNLCALWIMYGVWSKRIWITTGLAYLFFIWLENVFMGWDYAESYNESPLIGYDYRIIFTDLFLKGNDRKVISFSFLIAGIHFISLGCYRIWRNFHVNYR